MKTPSIHQGDPGWALDNPGVPKTTSSNTYEDKHRLILNCRWPRRRTCPTSSNIGYQFTSVAEPTMFPFETFAMVPIIVHYFGMLLGWAVLDATLVPGEEQGQLLCQRVQQYPKQRAQPTAIIFHLHHEYLEANRSLWIYSRCHSTMSV